jgi:hypothetical protein
MAWRTRPPIERTRQGYRVNLGPDERGVLSSLLDQLRSLLLGPADQPLLRRLFPAAYHLPEHAEHDAEYQRLMRDDLVASRLASISLIEEVLSSDGALTERQIEALAQGINGVRLVLGTLLDISEEHDPDDVDPDDPLAGEYQLYGYLSWLLEWAVRALSP